MTSLKLAQRGDTVKIHYTGRLQADGRVFDSTRDRSPLQLTLGEGKTLKGFEDAVVGMFPGQIRRVEIPCRQAFGPRLRNMERVLRPDLVPRGTRLRIGHRLRIQENGQSPTVVTIIGRSGEEVMIDTNHPLAGHDLIFEIELLEIL